MLIPTLNINKVTNEAVIDLIDTDFNENPIIQFKQESGYSSAESWLTLLSAFINQSIYGYDKGYEAGYKNGTEDALNSKIN